MNEPFRQSVLLGAATGLRSTGGLAALAVAHREDGAPPLVSDGVRRALGVVLALESVADKLLPLPARTDPAPLAGRVALGAAAAAWAQDGPASSRLRAAMVGAGAAALTARIATSVRAGAGRRGLPDFLPAFAEDLFVGGVVAALRRRSTSGLRRRRRSRTPAPHPA